MKQAAGDNGSDPRGRSPGRLLYRVAAASIAGLALWAAVRGVEWRHVAQVIVGADLRLIAIGCAIGTGAVLARALRSQLLLRGLAPVDFVTIFGANAAGNFGNAFLPARAGEVIRIFMISAGSGLSKAAVLTTALVERVVDAIALILIASGTISWMDRAPRWLGETARLSAAPALLAGAALLALPKVERSLRRALNRIPIPGAAIRVATGLDHVTAGLAALQNRSRVCRFGGLTILIWCADACGVMFAAWALRLNVGFRLSLVLVAAVALASSLPFIPGALGVYQFVGISVLIPFSITRADALAFTLVLQALSFLTVSFWGLVALWGGRISAIPARGHPAAG